jgi:hypothetical protein
VAFLARGLLTTRKCSCGEIDPPARDPPATHPRPTRDPPATHPRPTRDPPATHPRPTREAPAIYSRPRKRKKQNPPSAGWQIKNKKGGTKFPQQVKQIPKTNFRLRPDGKERKTRWNKISQNKNPKTRYPKKVLRLRRWGWIPVPHDRPMPTISYI